jgi:N utilization substance protein B
MDRHRAREAALQILYSAELSKEPLSEVLIAYFDEHWPDAPDPARALARTIATGTLQDRPELDALIARQSANWRLERIAVIDRLILRMAIWELRHETDTPAAVVLDEAIELARTFGADQSVAFVNGVLDGVRKALENERH